ncbi:MAG: DNA-3-methyladenine glycosylase family protein [Actinomycetota bacterium]
MPSTLEVPLLGGGGEPVDLRRTLNSHGFVDLAPFRLDEANPELEVTLRVPRGRPRRVHIGAGGRGMARVVVDGPAIGPSTAEALTQRIRHVLRLDADLSPFYAMAAADPDLAWAASGAGRMVQGPTVFEDVVKTICTTNCAWSGTIRMVSALVGTLGEPARDAPSEGPLGRAFPTPAAMAAAGDAFYRDVARAGYRGAYLRSLAEMVVEGRLDLEALGAATRDELSDDELEQALLALPGVGPYAAAHVMLMLGRYSRLILDSWSRPTYARITARRTVKDTTIVRRFRRYGPYAGLAFWLLLTRDWVDT